MTAASDIKKRLEGARAALKSLGVTSLSLFGSRARGDATAASDADFLVEFDGPVSFDRFMDLKLLLEDLLGCSIDLVTRAALRPPLLKSIEKDAVRVA